MLDAAELQTLFSHDESERVERKESLSDKEKIRQAICAMANDLPGHGKTGVIFVGQRDDKSCAGLNVDQRLLETLAAIRSDGNILPFPVMSVRKETFGLCTVAVIEVEPSTNPPVKLAGRIWIRVGPRRAIATAEEERRLLEKRRWGNLPFDAHGVVGASVDNDLDLKRFRIEYLPSATSPEALAENSRPVELQLRVLRLSRPDGTPTVTGILMLGVDPRAWIPGAYIQFLRIDGIELTDGIRDQQEISGTVGDQLRQMDELVRLNISHPSKIGGPSRLETPDYPEEAIRQLVRNALLHRSYEGTHAPVRITWFNDRIEIQSPGGPFGQVTRTTFGTGVADYRNPTLAEALKDQGFVERFGVGIAIARNSLAMNGNPAPEFIIEDAHVLAIVRARP